MAVAGKPRQWRGFLLLPQGIQVSGREKSGVAPVKRRAHICGMRTLPNG